MQRKYSYLFSVKRPLVLLLLIGLFNIVSNQQLRVNAADDKKNFQTSTYKDQTIINKTTSSNDIVGNSLEYFPPWLGNSTDELNLFMKDEYNYFVTAKGNKVWACAMSLAWNQLKRQLLSNENVSFYRTDILQQKMVDNLNSQLFTESQISQNSYYVKSGWGQQTVDTINFQVKQKFPLRTFADIEYAMSNDSFISFAYLYKKFLFKTSFQEAQDFTFKGQLVDAFKATRSKHKNQLYYKYYNNKDDFLMGIQTKDENQQVLLLKYSGHPEIKNFTIQKVFYMIQMYDQMENKKVTKHDFFSMPVLDFDFERNYKQLINLPFTNPQLSGYKISAMYQNLKLKVTKDGVQLQNQAVMGLTTSRAIDPKFFILDDDFWLILKQKNKKPYLIISVNSTKQSWSV